MRVLFANRPRLLRIAALALLCAALAGFAQEPKSEGSAPGSAEESAQNLEPAFRLPIGGLPIAGPRVDGSVSPALAWLLSQDGNLYALDESGKLIAKAEISGRPGQLLSIDPFGRVLIAPTERRIVALTRGGKRAWSFDFEKPLGLAPAFGADGRLFVPAGDSLVCLNPAGRRLWSMRLPAALAAAPVVDGLGRLVLALSDGRLLFVSPWAEHLAWLETGSRVLAMLATPAASEPGAMTTKDWRDKPSLALGLADGRLCIVTENRTDSTPALRSLPSLGAPISDLAWDGDRLFALDREGSLGIFSGADSMLWSARTGCAFGTLALFEKRVVITAATRTVSLSYEGVVKRELTVLHSAGMPAASASGLLFAAGRDWVLAAYRFEAPMGRRSPPRPASSFEAVNLVPGLVQEELLFDPLANDPDRQRSKLDDIEKSLESGTIGSGEVRAAAYCMGLLDGSLNRGGGPVLAAPDLRLRARACLILGALGSPEYRGPLILTMNRDPEALVRAAACKALTAISVDPEGLSGAAFLAAAEKPVDEATALAIIEALEGLALRSGTVMGPDSARALVKFAARPYSGEVRNRALKAMGRAAGIMDSP